MNFRRIDRCIVLIFFFLSSSLLGQAQLFKSGGVLDRISKIAPGTGNVSWKPGAAITTSIKDSLPGFRVLNDSDFDARSADPVVSFMLGPGYYRTTIRSYCLHAGAYGASKGNGYQIARLKGNCATLISSILDRSADHPDIVQQDVQMLIWGIEAGNKFTDYSPDFQLRVKPLLTEKDIAQMQFKIDHVAEKMVPASLKDMVDTYATLRSKMDKAQMDYDDIEKVAVKAGVPPTGLGSVDIKEGVWSYIGNGFYIRVYPRNYATTDLEIYRPGSFIVKKDNKDRITSFTRGPETVTIEYDDDPGADLYTSEGHPSIPIWRFKRFVYANSEKGINEEIRNKGWILRGSLTDMSGYFAAVQLPASHHGGPYISLSPVLPEQKKETISWSDLYARYKEASRRYRQAKEATDWANRIEDAGKLKNYDDYLNEKAAQQRIDAGVKAALNPTNFKGKSDWIYDLIKMDRDLMYWIDCQLAGSCNDSNDPAKPDLPTKVGQPGNSGAQRLGLSAYVKK
jgi:hypothetical protein